jgi:two-component system sensor histidine kinase RegB
VPVALQLASLEERLALRTDHTLSQALLSLLNNAADASPGSVELRAAQDDLVLVVQILDRGPGIAPQLRERLVRRFVTTKGRGGGVGVFIANGAIERFGGSVRIFDRKNGGTRVRVELPAFVSGPGREPRAGTQAATG